MFTLPKVLLSGESLANNFFFSGRPPANNFLFSGGPPANNFLFAGGPPGNKFLFAGGPPANNLFLMGNRFNHLRKYLFHTYINILMNKSHFVKNLDFCVELI